MTAQADPREGVGAPREPLALRLVNRSSLLGAVAVLAVAAVYAVGLPWLGALAAADDAQVAALAVGPSLVVTDTDGWGVTEQGAATTTLAKDGATLVITVAVNAPMDLEAARDAVVAGWDDLQADAVVTTSPPYQTSPGYDVAGAVAHTTTDVRQVWIVSDGQDATTVTLSAPSAAWDVASESARVVVDSLRFIEGSS